jgi:hypothetical protein
MTPGNWDEPQGRAAQAEVPGATCSASDTPITDRLEHEQECNFDVGWEDACRELERESTRLRKALKTVLASAHPHPMENGAMYEAWEFAKKALTPNTVNRITPVDAAQTVKP